MGEQVSTTDLYESTFYLLGGCELVSIEAIVRWVWRQKKKMLDIFGILPNNGIGAILKKVCCSLLTWF